MPLEWRLEASLAVKSAIGRADKADSAKVCVAGKVEIVSDKIVK